MFATEGDAHHVRHLSKTNIDPPDQLECFMESGKADTHVKLDTVVLQNRSKRAGSDCRWAESQQ